MAVSKTTNSGSTWIRYSLTSGYGTTYSVEVDPVNSTTVYAGGYENSSGAIYKTTNAGNNWYKLSATGLSGYVYHLAIDPIDTDILYAGTSSGVYCSTNAGTNWTSTGFSGGQVNAVLIDPADHLNIFAGTNYNGVYRSTDGGSTWLQINDGLLELSINRLGIDPENYLFAGTTEGSVYRLQLEPGAVKENNETPRARSTVQVYPNPMTHTTTISYHLSTSMEVDLSIYDIQGRLVKRLSSGVQASGIHTRQWDGKDEKQEKVPAGVYLCELTTETTSRVEKIILLK